MSGEACTRLARALRFYFGNLSGLDHRTVRWSSATFVGTQHVLWFDVETSGNLSVLLENLAEADLPMPGHFVADIEVMERNDGLTRTRIGLRALTIVEA